MIDDKGQAEEWVVYTVEDLFGGTLWLFWRAEIGEWVSDLARATRYPAVAAQQMAAERAAAEEIDVRVILANEVA